jgi:hypothetical protein
MKELQLEVRLSMCGVYENTLTIYIEIPEDTTDEDEMAVMMKELNVEMADMYDDYEEWEDGNISWTLETWEEL